MNQLEDVLALDGPPGSGKSFLAAEFVNSAHASPRRILIMTPIGALAEVYRQRYLSYENVTVGTFDSATKFCHHDKNLVFMSLNYDVIVVDEIEYLDRVRVQHLIECWEQTGTWAHYCW